MKSSASTCPVPTEQQPLNEYQELRESWFFHWGVLDWRGYLIKLAWVWGGSWLISAPVAAGSFAPSKHIAQFLLCSAAGASGFLALIVIQLWLGWSYVHHRLLQETIVYEESGWYDGQTWTKPPEVLTRDRLIVSYQIEPILQRLKKTFGILILFFFSGSLIWKLL